MSSATYTVLGMTCGHCVNAVTEEASQVPGVTAVDVDLASGGLTVTSEAPVDEAAVPCAVEEAGYEGGGRWRGRASAPAGHEHTRRTADRWHDLRLVRRPHREEAQQAGRRHRYGQLRHREGQGQLAPGQRARGPEPHRREDRLHGPTARAAPAPSRGSPRACEG